jgi:prepilin-type N-terminal cleavage/methylation domain-containing protein
MKKKNFAFTLSEILIAIVIIGVISAITIPNLISAYRKKIVEVRLKNFYTIVNNALLLAENDYGEREGWDPVRPIIGSVTDKNGTYIKSTSTYWAEKYLMPYIKSEVKISEKNGKTYLYFSTNNGALSIDHQGFVYYPNGVKFDSSGNPIIKKGINAFTFYYGTGNDWALNGKDSENRKYFNRNIEVYNYAWNGTYKQAKTGSKYSCDNGGEYCALLIKLNSWKVPKDYPYKF